MRIGGGVALLVIGAILTFAVNVTLAGVDLRIVGWILMGAGALLLVIGLVVGLRGRSRTVTSETTQDPTTNRQVRRSEYHDDEF